MYRSVEQLLVVFASYVVIWTSLHHIQSVSPFTCFDLSSIQTQSEKVSLNSNASFQTQVLTCFSIPDINCSIHFQGCLDFWSAEKNSNISTVQWRYEPTNQTGVVFNGTWKVIEWVGLNSSCSSESPNVSSHCLKFDSDCIQLKRLSSIYFCDNSSTISSQSMDELKQSFKNVFWLSNNGSKTYCNRTTLTQILLHCGLARLTSESQTHGQLSLVSGRLQRLKEHGRGRSPESDTGRCACVYGFAWLVDATSYRVVFQRNWNNCTLPRAAKSARHSRRIPVEADRRKGSFTTGLRQNNGQSNRILEQRRPWLRKRKTRTAPDAYSQLDVRDLQPKHLQIIPVHFGAFNVSWYTSPAVTPWISHYELVLINLGDLPSLEEQKLCLSFLQAHNVTHHGHSTTQHRIWHERQLTMNITAPTSYVMVDGLPPDNFYRVLLFAVSGELRGFPASMPSSPRVPSLPPLTAPNEIRCTTSGNQEIRVEWKPPDGIDCTGELINYVISVNSSRLIEPLLIKVDRGTNSYIVKDLLPGTYYTIQMSASTRGGMGVFSDPLHFRTGGEVPRVDLDDTEDLEDLPELTEPHSQFYEREVVQSRWITTHPSSISVARLHMVPVKIHNLRATPGETSIHLKWSVALRRVNPDYEQELFPRPNGGIHSSHVASRQPLRIPLSTGPNSDDQTGYLPPGTKYIIRWGDMHPGPAEDTVLGDQTEYLIQNLRPGTIYYIRVIAVTRLGDGPAAYTVTMTKNLKMGTPKPLSTGLIIPVNLVVRAVGASWARVGWELPEVPISYRSPSLLFQIKYYPIHLDQARAVVTLRPPNEGSTGTGVVSIVNVTVPWTAQLSQQSKLFKAMLRGLQPATQYEFGVCMMQQEPEDRGRHNHPANSGEPTELCWSMVQGFETVGQNPADPPRNIRVTFPKGVVAKRNFYFAEDSTASQNTEKSTQVSAEVLTVRLSWDPPRQPYGTIIAYLIYFTVDKHKMLNEWLEHTALGEVRQTDLPEMRSSEVYFLRMTARNRHGASPFSPVIVFRTPDANGIGGGMVRLSKVYYDAREIEESLDQTDPDFRLELNSEAADRASHTSEQQNTTTREQLQWIIVGCVLGGTVVIVLVALTVLLHRCHYTGHSLGIVKRSSSKQPYVAGYPNYYPNDTNCLPPEFNAKNPNLNLTDACLGSCSLNGSAVGGSATGVFGTCVTSDSSGGPRGIPDCSGHPVIGSHLCSCSDWSSTGRQLTNGNVHSCGVMESKCPCRVASDAVQITGGWVQPGDSSGCYADDRHSSQNDSENGAVVLCGNELHRIDTALGRRPSERMACDVPECCNYTMQKAVGCGSCTNNWNRPTNDTPNHQMTTSFLASNLHHPVPQFNQTHLYRDHCDATPPQHSRYARPVTGRQPVYIAEVGERSLETPFQKPRNMPITMIGFTGSGSLNEDEAIASSPASSSVERTSGGLHHSSVSPTHGPNRLRTYSQHHQYPNLYATSKTEHNGPQRTFVCETQQAANKIGRKLSNPMNHSSPLNTPGQTPRTNVMSSDYASQQSSLSNPSSVSSAADHGFSPERPASNISTSIGTENRANDVGLSFALDRVPTPEPTPRPAPFSRLATGELNQRAQIRLYAQKLDKEDVDDDDYLKSSDKVQKQHETPLTMSPTLLKKSQLSVFANGPNTLRDMVRQRKIFPHESTPDTVDSISEKELLREYSAEELNQEMANLEGLMKDLNQITQNQFNS